MLGFEPVRCAAHAEFGLWLLLSFRKGLKMNKLLCSICGLEIKDDQTVMKTLDDEKKIKEAWHEQCYYGKRAIDAFMDQFTEFYDLQHYSEDDIISALKNLILQDADQEEDSK